MPSQIPFSPSSPFSTSPNHINFSGGRKGKIEKFFWEKSDKLEKEKIETLFSIFTTLSQKKRRKGEKWHRKKFPN
ncbi:MAG: hypothetical protein C6I01_03680 [Epsilonproteobacteria bacterium]|nr:hypothetical protein [Campylobacterota bacterium]